MDVYRGGGSGQVRSLGFRRALGAGWGKREEGERFWGALCCCLAGPRAQAREVCYFSCSDFPL